VNRANLFADAMRLSLDVLGSAELTHDAAAPAATKIVISLI